MEFDWFTYVAQIVNFGILIFLLWRFLYKPVLRMMHQREAELAERFRKAESARAEAERQAEEYRAKVDELETQREQMLASAEAEASELRQALVANVRTEAQQLQDRWYASIEQEKQLFLADLRQRVARQVFVVVRRALDDLAHADLESQVITLFVRRLQEMPTEEASALLPARGATSLQVTVRSGFEVPSPKRQQVIDALQALLARDDDSAPISVRWELEPTLLCGIELQVRDRRIGWSLRDYLDELEEETAALLDADAHNLRSRVAVPSNRQA